MTSLLILNTPENQKTSIKIARGKQTKHTGTSQICKNTTIYIHKRNYCYNLCMFSFKSIFKLDTSVHLWEMSEHQRCTKGPEGLLPFDPGLSQERKLRGRTQLNAGQRCSSRIIYKKENLSHSQTSATESWSHEELLYKMLSNRSPSQDGKYLRTTAIRLKGGELNSAKVHGTRSTQKNHLCFYILARTIWNGN